MKAGILEVFLFVTKIHGNSTVTQHNTTRNTTLRSNADIITN